MMISTKSSEILIIYIYIYIDDNGDDDNNHSKCCVNCNVKGKILRLTRSVFTDKVTPCIQHFLIVLI